MRPHALLSGSGQASLRSVADPDRVDGRGAVKRADNVHLALSRKAERAALLEGLFRFGAFPTVGYHEGLVGASVHQFLDTHPHLETLRVLRFVVELELRGMQPTLKLLEQFSGLLGDTLPKDEHSEALDDGDFDRFLVAFNSTHDTRIQYRVVEGRKKSWIRQNLGANPTLCLEIPEGECLWNFVWQEPERETMFVRGPVRRRRDLRRILSGLHFKNVVYHGKDDLYDGFSTYPRNQILRGLNELS